MVKTQPAAVVPEANSQHVSWESFKTAVGVEPVAQEAPAEVPETSVEDPTQFKDDPVERQQLAHIMRQAIAAGLSDAPAFAQMEEHIAAGRFSRSSYIVMWTERLQIAGIQLKTQLLMPDSNAMSASELRDPSLASSSGPRERTRLADLLAYERGKRGLPNPVEPALGGELLPLEGPPEQCQDAAPDAASSLDGMGAAQPNARATQVLQGPVYEGFTLPAREGARRVLVTGASSGIGLRAAIAFLQKGDLVAMVSRSMSPALLPTLLPAELVPFAVAISADLTLEEGCAAAAQEATGALGGRLDILVNAAGATRLGCASPTPQSKNSSGTWM